MSDIPLLPLGSKGVITFTASPIIIAYWLKIVAVHARTNWDPYNAFLLWSQFALAWVQRILNVGY